MKSPTISVVVPYYNTADYLKSCLDSLVKQTLSPVEIIVVDDGSSVKPASVLNKYPEVKLIEHKENKGINGAKNTGFAQARGDYIFFAESDALYKNTCLEKLYKAIKLGNYDFSYCDFVFVNKTNGHKKLIKGRPFSYESLKRKSYISNSSLYKKASVVKADETIKRFTDWSYWLNVAKQGQKGKYVSEVLFEAYLRPGGVSTGDPFDREFWRLAVQRKHGMEPKVAIYTFTRDRLDYTKRTFKKLSSLGYPFDHYIVDNGSQDNTPTWLKEYQKSSPNKVILTLLKENIGIAAAKNLVIKKLSGKYDYILKIDNDCEIISSNILHELILISRVLNNNAVLSPRVEGLRRPVPRYAYFKIGPHNLSPVPLVGGIFCFSPAKFYTNFISNPIFKIAKGDLEFAENVWKNKGKIYYVDDLEVIHMDNTSGQILKFPSYFKRRDKELSVQEEKVNDSKTTIKFGVKNADYWQENYRISKNWQFAALSLAARLGINTSFLLGLLKKR